VKISWPSRVVTNSKEKPKVEIRGDRRSEDQMTSTFLPGISEGQRGFTCVVLRKRENVCATKEGPVHKLHSACVTECGEVQDYHARCVVNHRISSVAKSKKTPKNGKRSCDAPATR